MRHHHADLTAIPVGLIGAIGKEDGELFAVRGPGVLPDTLSIWRNRFGCIAVYAYPPQAAVSSLPRCEDFGIAHRLFAVY